MNDNKLWITLNIICHSFCLWRNSSVINHIRTYPVLSRYHSLSQFFSVADKISLKAEGLSTSRDLWRNQDKGHNVNGEGCCYPCCFFENPPPKKTKKQTKQTKNYLLILSTHALACAASVSVCYQCMHVCMNHRVMKQLFRPSFNIYLEELQWKNYTWEHKHVVRWCM